MKELLDDRTSGVVVCLLVRTSGVVVCLLVVHALLVIGGNRTMDVDRSVVHAPSLDKSMERPQSSHLSTSIGPNQLVASVKINGT